MGKILELISVLWRLMISDEITRLTAENQLLRTESRNVQDQVSQEQEKVRKKRESFLILQQEKENLFNDLK